MRATIYIVSALICISALNADIEIEGDYFQKKIDGINKDVHHRSRRQVFENRIPPEFDARLAWKFCPSIGHYMDASACVSAALLVAAAINDRICIASNAKHRPSLSAMDIIDCCSNCGGCTGDVSSKLAWDYWVNEGLPTGNNHQEEPEGCKPYPNRTSENDPIPSCSNFCTLNITNSTTYDDEKLRYKGVASYALISGDVRMMQEEIMTNGPIVARMSVNGGFLNFKGGVYIQEKDHWFDRDVKLIGWGTEGRELDYWLGVSYLGQEWGRNGLFKIQRSVNMSGIESKGLTAGMPQFPPPNTNMIANGSRIIDLVFVIDSTVIDAKFIAAVSHVLGLMSIAETTHYNVGFVTYGDTATVKLRLKPYRDKAYIMANLNTILTAGRSQNANLESGVSAAHIMLTTEGRVNAIWIAMLIVGSNIRVSNVEVEVNKCRKEGVVISVLGLDVMQQSELSDMAARDMSLFTYRSIPRGFSESRTYFKLPQLLEIIGEETEPCSQCNMNQGLIHHAVLGTCDQFFKCRGVNDPDPNIQRCPAFTLWDEDVLNCNWAGRVWCRSDPCRRNAGMTSYSDTDNCALYWVCRNSRTVYSKCCPEGQSFNQQSGTCVDDSSCTSFCRQRGRCYPEMEIDFFDGFIEDISYNLLTINNGTVNVVGDGDSIDGWAAVFRGLEFLTVPFFANNDLRNFLQIYIRFKPEENVIMQNDMVEVLVTNGGCDPSEPAVFIGYNRASSYVEAHVVTSIRTTVLFMDVLQNRYVDIWLTYNRTTVMLTTADIDGSLLTDFAYNNGWIRRVHNAIQIGGMQAASFKYTDFIGSIDEVWISRCEVVHMVVEL